MTNVSRVQEKTEGIKNLRGLNIKQSSHDLVVSFINNLDYGSAFVLGQAVPFFLAFLLATTWGYILEQKLPVWLFLFAYMPLALVVGTCFRFFEAMVHDIGGHLRISGKKLINDWVGNIIFAYPLGRNCRTYREGPLGHLTHHNGKKYGTNSDPDSMEYDNYDYSDIRAHHSHLAFLAAVIKRYPTRIYGWVASMFSNPESLLGFIVWHTMVIVGLSLAGVNEVIYGWLLWFAIPFIFITTGLRIIGESEEHTYSTDLSNEFKSTVNNMSFFQKYFVHPGKDYYHAAHHLYPNAPVSSQFYVHALLCALEPTEYKDSLTIRKSILTPDSNL